MIAEIASALVLLVGAGLMLKSFARLLAVNPGFDSNRVLTARIWLPSSGYADNSSKLQFFDQLLSRVKGLPGVESASLTTALPMTGVTFGAPFSIEGRAFDPAGRPPHAYIRSVAPNYFRTLGISRTVTTALRDSDCADLLPGALAFLSMALLVSERPHVPRPASIHLRAELAGTGPAFRRKGDVPQDELPKQGWWRRKCLLESHRLCFNSMRGRSGQMPGFK